MNNKTIIVVDASAVLAVLLGEERKQEVLNLTNNVIMTAPDCIDFEIGNSLSALIKRDRIIINQAREIYNEFEKVKIQRLRVNVGRAVVIAGEHNIYAYDAYYLEIAQRYKLPLLTLDRRMADVAAEREVVCLL